VRGDAREGTDTVTDQKSLKRRVRARMSKTGERYTAARRNLIARPEADAPTAPVPPGDLVPDGNFRGNRPMSDDQLALRTGRPWSEWYEVLESSNARDLPHAEIARWLSVEHGVDGWWTQELTVRYEVAIGRRKPGQRADGFYLSATKTVGVPVERLFDAFVDAGIRATWLPVEGIRLRTAAPHKSARFDWKGGSERLVVGFTAKGDAKSTVAIEHSRFPDQDAAEREKPLWRDRLAALKRLLEA
jgi:hypothetical protein